MKSIFTKLNDNLILHSLKGTLNSSLNKNRALIFVHGASRDNQNAGHWKPLEPYLEESLKNDFSSFYFVDLLGHGGSTPDAKGEKIGIEVQIKALKQLIEEEKLEENILVGRSFGGKVVNLLASEIPEKIIGMGFISPAVNKETLNKLPKRVLENPCFCIWASDDVIIFPNFTLMKEFFKDEKKRVFVDFGKVLNSSIPKNESWRAHTPELQNLPLFKEKFSLFLDLVVNNRSK
eukprot:TRINITY_DN12633_c0_g1_i1.p1 TRINITY_DN12633_c0_g1~~TRINITY_DN12633_c0_g1_i1.p1  ORF type:complete len:234 (+),score=55.06 TRINITY_DN12633_c0_g1_i1:1-702(+)